MQRLTDHDLVHPPTNAERSWVSTAPAWILGALVTLVCLLAYLPTATWDYDQVTDTRATAIAAWSLADHGTIQVDTSWPDVPWARQGADDDWYVWRHPGGIVWSALFYLPTNLGVEPASALEVPYGPATLSAVLATALGVGVMTRVFRTLVDASTAMAGGLVLGLATANWSISADAAWNHGPTLLFLALGLLFMTRRQFAASGLAMAVAITVRPHVAVAPAALGLAEAWRQRSWRPALTVGVTSALGLAATIGFYWAVFGEPSMRPDQVESFVSGDVNLAEHGWLWNTWLSLVDPISGVLVHSPWIVLLAVGIPAAWRTAPTWVRSAAIGGALYGVVQTRTDVYHAGMGFFGSRAHLETLTLAAPLLILALHELRDRRARLARAVELTAAASVIVFAVASIGRGPLAPPTAHCDIQRTHEASYLPDAMRLERLEDALVECHDVPREEARRRIDEGLRTDAR